MSKNNYFNILDFGSSKIRFSVFDHQLNETYSISKIIKLEENDLSYYKEVKNIIKKAEKNISSHIEDIILTLDTSELISIDISLKKNLDRKTDINKIYESLVLEVSQIINTFYNKVEILHIVLCRCIIDNNTYFELPTDKKYINNIKVDFKLICFPKYIINKIKKNFNENNINITNIFCTSYVKSLSYLRKLNIKNLSFIEIGLKKTCFISFEKNKLKIIQTIPIGGIHITNDISKIFKISFDEAEKIKKSFNKSDTEFSYENNNLENNFSVTEILSKNISVDILKKVILYRVQEIIDLAFKKSNIHLYEKNLKKSDLFFIGEGSLILNNNSFYLNDKFEFNTLSFYNETDNQICNSGLVYFMNNYEIPKRTLKKQGFFEKFFNYFGK